MTVSPYHQIEVKDWYSVTKSLIEEHPLGSQEIVDITLQVWNSIFRSKIGSKPFHIGQDIFPKPQIMGFLLHELIPLELEFRYPNSWRGDKEACDKDLVYISDQKYSIELKTSSSQKQIYGNRSYAQESSSEKKVKSGYYLAINFEKFTSNNTKPKISLIRFGWIDSSDWIGQKSATGQQSRLHADVDKYKLITLYPES